MLGHQRANQFVHITFGNRVNFIEREVNAVVGNAALRVVVGADALTAIARTNQAFTLAGNGTILCIYLFRFNSSSKHG